MKRKIVLNNKQTLEFFKLDETERIGSKIKTMTKLEDGSVCEFKGVVESYKFGYGDAILVCEGEEVKE